MRILVSDYSGHPFQVQLSRALAARGHEVVHVSSASFQTPKGRLENDAGDASTFRSVTVTTAKPFAKASFVKRRAQEIEIGRRIAEQVAAFRPDMVLSSNAPLDTQRHILRATKQAGAKFIFWVQDLYGEAILRVLSGKLGIAGRVVGRFYSGLEARMLRASDGIVAIAGDFVPAIVALSGVPAERVSVVENWAPLDEIRQYPRDNDWAAANLPAASLRLVYSGTLGFKHNPSLLLELAREVDADVLVFSEGAAADQLKADAAAQGVTNLSVRPWLPFADLPKALAAADVLLVILEPDAGVFSVPSKVLTYMCVGRPILGAIPGENLSARLIQGNGAGLVAEPTDAADFAGEARVLIADADMRAHCGAAARDYAERTFDIDTIASRFEAIIMKTQEGSAK